MALKDFYSETKKLIFQPYIILLFHRNVYPKPTGILVSVNLHVIMFVHVAGFSSVVSLAIRGQCSIVAKRRAPLPVLVVRSWPFITQFLPASVSSV